MSDLLLHLLGGAFAAVIMVIAFFVLLVAAEIVTVLSEARVRRWVLTRRLRREARRNRIVG